LQQFFSSSRQSTQSPFQHEVDRKFFNPAPDSPVEPDHDVVYEDTGMLLQPDTRPISQEQLVNEVKGIYAGLVMVEKKCVEICQEQSQSTVKLSNEQWQALIALHRTLLHEHHDFFLASQHPTASPALRRLPTKYAM
jgi:polyribonucleotide nucleotidyltransferase